MNFEVQGKVNPDGGRDTSGTELSPSAHIDIWKWTLSWPICCFVHDVLNAKIEPKPAPSLYYVCRRPCTYATILGVVVSVSQYESRSVLSIDDGSGIIECIRLLKQSTASYFEGRTYPYTPDAPESSNSPALLADTGATVSLVGKIVTYRDANQLHIDRMGDAFYFIQPPLVDDTKRTSDRVTDPNQEPTHWLNVVNDHYNNRQDSEKFVIPDSQWAKKTPMGLDESLSEIPSACTPLSPKTRGSEGKLVTLLSHPRRLSTRQLTLATFRIYIQYYMEKVLNLTPNLTIPSMLERYSQSCDTFGTYEGFTISYLRRVPELHLLASRIVKSAYKAQFKEQIRQARSSSQPCQDRTNLSISSRDSSMHSVKSLPGANELCRKTKTLFTRTMQELYRNGSVILSFGPHRPHPCSESGFFPEMTQYWKESRGDHPSSRSFRDRDIFDLTVDNGFNEHSGPGDGEDAYLPLSRELLCMKVIDTLIAMYRASIQTRIKYAVPGDNPLFDGKIRPPSPGEVANWLGREEEWCQVGEMLVMDALRHLCELGVVYKVPHGRWQIHAEYLRKRIKTEYSTCY